MGTEHIRRNRHNDSGCFWSGDFISGYFQIPLHPDSQALTTFVTPWGRFCFLALPMGINDSMDSFNISTDPIVSGINKTLKSVDDVLGQGRDPQQELLIKKIKLRRRTFHIGTQ